MKFICIHSTQYKFRISSEFAHVHTMSTLTTKINKILLNAFRKVAMINYFSSISFWLNFISLKGHNS